MLSSADLINNIAETHSDMRRLKNNVLRSSMSDNDEQVHLYWLMLSISSALNFFVLELLVIYKPTMNNGLRLLFYQIAICCLHTSVL